MTPREHLRRLVEELAESELETAERVLTALHATAGPSYSLAEAPPDDEPDDDDFDGGLREARAEADSGQGISTEELEREARLTHRRE